MVRVVRMVLVYCTFAFIIYLRTIKVLFCENGSIRCCDFNRTALTRQNTKSDVFYYHSYFLKYPRFSAIILTDLFVVGSNERNQSADSYSQPQCIRATRLSNTQTISYHCQLQAQLVNKFNLTIDLSKRPRSSSASCPILSFIYAKMALCMASDFLTLSNPSQSSWLEAYAHTASQKCQSLILSSYLKRVDSSFLKMGSLSMLILLFQSVYANLQVDVFEYILDMTAGVMMGRLNLLRLSLFCSKMRSSQTGVTFSVLRQESSSCSLKQVKSTLPLKRQLIISYRLRKRSLSYCFTWSSRSTLSSLFFFIDSSWPLQIDKNYYILEQSRVCSGPVTLLISSPCKGSSCSSAE